MPVAAYTPPPFLPPAAVIYAEVAPVTEAPNRQPREVAAQELSARLLKDLSGQVLTAGQQAVFELQGLNLRLTVGSLTADGGGAEENEGGRQRAGAGRPQPPPTQTQTQQQHREVARAMVVGGDGGGGGGGGAPPPSSSSSFIFTNSNASAVRITGQKGIATTALFKQRQLNFESLGIGGLDSQFEAIFRRAFASRVFPPSVLERLGIHHVKVRKTFTLSVSRWHLAVKPHAHTPPLPSVPSLPIAGRGARAPRPPSSVAAAAAHASSHPPAPSPPPLSPDQPKQNETKTQNTQTRKRQQ